ncbi:MAG: hypothetical protein WC729_01765 [Sphingomonas sp.]|jgi:hypothetical protein|uniref:hypothetical protein n=1 Tax=Sphingomonas sp. TaxID=28214 RepID=UPI003563E42F
MRKDRRHIVHASCLALSAAWAVPAWSQTTPAPETAPAGPVDQAQSPASATPPALDASPPDSSSDSGTDIFSKNTITVLLDARLVGADGSRSFVDGGLGKTRFSGGSNGDFRVRPLPVEADLIWQPRFTNSLSATVSGAWQRDQENDFDLLESFVTFNPPSSGKLRFSAKAGLYWPEISLEHATGGAWSTVYTITPSAINSWVGEEVKVIGTEATASLSLGEHQVSATAGLFGFNDTSGTLLSFRGWALHDVKATAFGHFQLPPLNPFIRLLQQSETRSLIDIDHRVGYYARLEWRPPTPFTVNVFYYDNRGDPQAFEPTGQWGWRTRFLNAGLTAELDSRTRVLMQGMTGATQMGFKTNGQVWVHTRFQSAYILVTHQIDKVAITGRIEAFGTHEMGSEMSPRESENGWALTAAARWTISNNVTGFAEALHVRSDRGVRTDIGLPATEHQNVVQFGLRFRLW